MIIKKPLTEEQKKILAERTKPAQDDINQAANDLIWSLMQRVAKLEGETNGNLPPLQS